MKKIKWNLKALKQLRKIKDLNTRETIYNAVDDLKNFPNCSNVKKIKNQEKFRLRVGRWRVFFTQELEILFIEEVKIRNENTY
jgi:mRNA-degrading endonuclease RelE of RelBE toxin-antitoxin system